MPKTARAIVTALAALALTVLAPAGVQALSGTVPATATASGTLTGTATSTATADCAGCWS
ncbi:hypothetical protein KDL01_37025 [Actinospica durhamensis]|uniref:Uncharacterized protein n=1 Tax=Actinospica durhamensis TaxID=1508375 RepID=A0A941EW63_9ACTN|nr:hypothetical protein [Actinospica durhamensis]MBR7838930.1 hypothetical protein [Actinospica durhamensis]